MLYSLRALSASKTKEKKEQLNYVQLTICLLLWNKNKIWKGIELEENLNHLLWLSPDQFNLIMLDKTIIEL